MTISPSFWTWSLFHSIADNSIEKSFSHIAGKCHPILISVKQAISPKEYPARWTRLLQKERTHLRDALGLRRLDQTLRRMVRSRLHVIDLRSVQAPWLALCGQVLKRARDWVIVYFFRSIYYDLFVFHFLLPSEKALSYLRNLKESSSLHVLSI